MSIYTERTVKGIIEYRGVEFDYEATIHSPESHYPDAINVEPSIPCDEGIGWFEDDIDKIERVAWDDAYKQLEAHKMPEVEDYQGEVYTCISCKSPELEENGGLFNNKDGTYFLCNECIEHLKNSENSIMAQVKKLGSLIAEKRSDLSEILFQIAEGKKFNPDDIEKRFVQGYIRHDSIPDKLIGVEYDTLTTLIEFRVAPDTKWHQTKQMRYTD